MKGKLEELKRASENNQHEVVWRVVKELSIYQGREPQLPRQRSKNQMAQGSQTPSDLLPERQQYSSKLLNNQPENAGINPSPAEVDLPIDTGNITKSETAKAIEHMKTGKGRGCDPSITAEALKHGGETVVEALHQICNAVFTRKILPSQWIRNVISPLPKKGSLYEMTNYRSTTLMSIAAKVYNRILLIRIRPFVDPTLKHNQAGFRTGRSCTQQVFILRRLMEGVDDYLHRLQEGF